MITGIPITIRSAQVTSSTVPYPDTGETLLVTSTLYNAGDTGSYLIGDLYHKFQAKQTHTSDFGDPVKTPQAYPDDEGNAYWTDLGAVNQLAPFQYTRNKTLVGSSPYIVSINPGGHFTAIGVGYIKADSVTLDVYDSSSVLIHTETQQLLKRNVYNFTTWVTAPIRQITKTIFTGLPLGYNNTCTLTFTRQSGSVQVGAIILTRHVNIGMAKYDADVHRENFSRFDRDDFTDIKINKKRNIPTRNLLLIIDKSKLDDVLDLIDDLNGEVTFWAGIVERTDGYFESLFAIGLYRDFTHTIKYPTVAEAKIEIQEL